MDTSPENTAPRKRHILLRILYAALWFVLFYFVTSAIVGGIVGGIAGGSAADPNADIAGNFSAGASAGRMATTRFMQKYGSFIFLSQIVSFTALCAFRLLPGVAKYKRSKNSSQCQDVPPVLVK